MHNLLKVKFNFSKIWTFFFFFFWIWEFKSMGMQRFRFRFKAKIRKSSFVWQKYPVTIRRRNKFSQKNCQVKSIDIEHCADSSLLRLRASSISYVECWKRNMKKENNWNWMWKSLQENNHLCNVLSPKIIIYCNRIRAQDAWCSGKCSCSFKLVIYFQCQIE